MGRETGVGERTIRKYIHLLALAPELQDRLAAGEAKNTEALLGYHLVRNCPFDCPIIPEPLQKQVAAMVDSFRLTS